MAFKLVKSNLAAFVATAIAGYKKSGEDMHVAIVSAIHNVARSGDVTLLNRIAESLRSNDAGALKLYIRRIGIANGLAMTGGPAEIEVLDTQTMEEMLKLGAVIGFSKGRYVCLQNPATDAAKNLVKLCEKRFLNPDGETDKMVFERNNFAEHKTLNDADVLKAVLKPINEALGNNADNKTFVLSETIKKRLEQIKNMLEVNHKQATLDKG